MHLLIVEDDVNLASALSKILEDAGYSVDCVHDGKAAFDYGSSGIYDAIILDVMIPHMDGFEVAHALRRAHVSTPILLLTARDATGDKITGYDSGADDYMTKPFSPAEFLAHLRALTRRRGEVIFETISSGDLTLDLENPELSCGADAIALSQKEFAIMRILMTSSNTTVSKDSLIARAWGPDSSASDNNVEAYISFLRKKLAHIHSEARIETLRSIGYRFVPSDDEDEKGGGNT